MLSPNAPALLLAPMAGITDAPMRALQGELGAFTFAVSEFVRVSGVAIPKKSFLRSIPELAREGLTCAGMPVQVQILGGNSELMAESAFNAWQAGARAIDVNFGCPAPTVNRRDGGATLLKYPGRVREIVAAVRGALPDSIPVSAKLRLGWENIEDVHENAAMATEGGASWLTVHARTRLQNYAPPVCWGPLARVRQDLGVPIVANGDVWSLDDFRRCRDETGCLHFMLGRGALANPCLPHQIARELGLPVRVCQVESDWISLLKRLSHHSHKRSGKSSGRTLRRLKQWLNIARRFGAFAHFDAVKLCQTEEALLAQLAQICETDAGMDLRGS